jgi:hypothetical protein
MDTNRSVLKACIASLALCATAAGAQTIYKQVDPEGRVMFTDQPNPAARVVASYETARPARRADSEMEEQAAQPARTAITETDLRPPAPVVMGTVATRSSADWPSGSAASAVPAPSAPSTREAERAANAYAPLQSASALQVDANESARRARQEMQKEPAAGVLIVKPLPRERDPAPRYEGFTAFYVMWAATFFLLAAGLLYVGWQIIRLILRGAFPRWQLGIG